MPHREEAAGQMPGMQQVDGNGDPIDQTKNITDLVTQWNANLAIGEIGKPGQASTLMLAGPSNATNATNGSTAGPIAPRMRAVTPLERFIFTLRVLSRRNAHVRSGRVRRCPWVLVYQGMC